MQCLLGFSINPQIFLALRPIETARPQLRLGRLQIRFYERSSKDASQKERKLSLYFFRRAHSLQQHLCRPTGISGRFLFHHTLTNRARSVQEGLKGPECCIV